MVSKSWGGSQTTKKSRQRKWVHFGRLKTVCQVMEKKCRPVMMEEAEKKGQILIFYINSRGNYNRIPTSLTGGALLLGIRREEKTQVRKG